jgi:hypothetical protein
VYVIYLEAWLMDHLHPEGLHIRLEDPVVRDGRGELLVGVCQLLEDRRVVAPQLINLQFSRNSELNSRC